MNPTNKLKLIGNKNDPENDQFLISVEEIVGKGQFGNIYKAYNYADYLINQEKNPICAKEIKREKISSKLMKSIQNEAQIQFQKISDYVVQIYSVKQTKSNIYFFLEYCPHGDLRNFLQKNRLNERQVLYLFGQICKAFKELKQYGVYHRDLKPANILLKDGNVKITDFGFSKIAQKDTFTNTQVGTPFYMSPQALSSDNYDLEKNDVWSAGVLLYEMIYYKIPWKVEAEDDQQCLVELLNVICKHKINFDYSNNGVKASQQVIDLIKLMLDLDEENRVDWEDINNKQIIINSFDENIKQEIIQMCKQ